MSDIIPTIKIKSASQKGFRIINRSAFDPSVHEAFDPSDAPKQNESTGAGLVAKHKGRGKFEVVDAAGNVLHEGLSKEEAEAIVAAG